MVTVADREADFYDLFATPRRDGSPLLICAKPRRRVRHAENLLDQALRAEPARGSFDVEIPRGPGRPARVASLAARFAAVSLAPPLNRRIGDRLADLRVRRSLPRRSLLRGAGANPVAAADDSAGHDFGGGPKGGALVLTTLAHRASSLRAQERLSGGATPVGECVPASTRSGHLCRGRPAAVMADLPGPASS